MLVISFGERVQGPHTSIVSLPANVYSIALVVYFPRAARIIAVIIVRSAPWSTIVSIVSIVVWTWVGAIRRGAGSIWPVV